MKEQDKQIYYKTWDFFLKNKIADENYSLKIDGTFEELIIKTCNHNGDPFVDNDPLQYIQRRIIIGLLCISPESHNGDIQDEFVNVQREFEMYKLIKTNLIL